MRRDDRRLDFQQQPMDNPAWWRGVTVYQIYPRSFADSKGEPWTARA